MGGKIRGTYELEVELEEEEKGGEDSELEEEKKEG